VPHSASLVPGAQESPLQQPAVQLSASQTGEASSSLSSSSSGGVVSSSLSSSSSGDESSSGIGDESSSGIGDESSSGIGDESSSSSGDASSSGIGDVSSSSSAVSSSGGMMSSSGRFPKFACVSWTPLAQANAVSKRARKIKVVAANCQRLITSLLSLDRPNDKQNCLAHRSP
jgi:hypothetical protein